MIAEKRMGGRQKSPPCGQVSRSGSSPPPFPAANWRSLWPAFNKEVGAGGCWDHRGLQRRWGAGKVSLSLSLSLVRKLLEGEEMWWSSSLQMMLK